MGDDVPADAPAPAYRPEPADFLADLLAVVRSQQAQIDRLVRLVEETRTAGAAVSLAPPPRQAPAGEAPIDWQRISGRERLLAWQKLADFVESTVYQFELQIDVTACWWKHSDAVEELTALWLARKAAYRPGAGVGAALPWLDALSRSRDRLRSVLLSCREGHVDTSMRGRPWMTDEIRADFVETVRREVTAADGGQAYPR